jgi:hypothetical protein|tara:strand:- start:2133 stop:2387 length:255 start_codon:yes stop_codon:yes gene_type:complete
MNIDELKKVNEMFWAVKGQMFPTEYAPKEMRRIYDSYFKRMWGNNEFYLHLEGFEEAWNNRKCWQTEIEEDELEFVAVKGGHFD